MRIYLKVVSILIPILPLIIYCEGDEFYDVTIDVRNKKIIYKVYSEFSRLYCSSIDHNDYGDEFCNFSNIGTVVMGYMHTPARVNGNWAAMTSYHPILVLKNGKKFNISHFSKTSKMGWFNKSKKPELNQKIVEIECIALKRLIFNDNSIMTVEKLDVLKLKMEPKVEMKIRYKSQGRYDIAVANQARGCAN